MRRTIPIIVLLLACLVALLVRLGLGPATDNADAFWGDGPPAPPGSLSMREGARLRIAFDPADAERDAAITAAERIVTARIGWFARLEPGLIEGSYRIERAGDTLEVVLPVLEAPLVQRLGKLLSRRGLLELKILVSPEEGRSATLEAERARLVAARADGTYRAEEERFAVFDNPRVDGLPAVPAYDQPQVLAVQPPPAQRFDMRGIESCHALQREVDGLWIVEAFVDAEVGARLRTLTETNRRKRLGIALDGALLAAPTIQGEVYSNLHLIGCRDRQGAHDLAVLIRTGPLPLPGQLVEVSAD